MERRSMRGSDRDDDRGRGRDDDRASSRRGRDDDDRPSRGRGRDDERPSRSRDRDDDDRPSRGRDRDDDDRGSSRGRFQYERRDDDAAKKRASKGAHDFDAFLRDDVKMFKVNDGNNTIRILPPTWPKPEHFGFDIHVHYGVGPDRQTYLCLHKMKGEPCPICEERKEALADGDEKYAKELEPKRRVLYYLIDREHEKEGLQAWASPWTVDRDIVKVMVDRKTGEALPIDDPDGGYDIEFEKKGAKDRTEYLGVAIARRDSDLGHPKALDFAVDNPLPEILVYYDYDHIKKAFGGGGAPATRSEKSSRDRDDDDRPSRGRDRDDDDRGSSRGRDRDRDDDRGGRESSRGKSDEDDLSWDSVHGMTFDELEALIESKDLKINPDRAKDEEELADWICEDLEIKKQQTVARRGKSDDDNPRERLASMRRDRG